MSSRGNLDLVIARLAGLKPRERAALCRAFGTEDELLRCPTRDLRALARGQEELSLGVAALDIEGALAAAERDRKLLAMRGIHHLSIACDGYPPLLKEIYDPPAILYWQGVFPPENQTVAVVGTRKPTAQAQEAARRISRELGEAGVAVVSGLALGTDAMAHRGNIEGGGGTVAVLGSAVDMVYPASNRQLARRILENGGAILSEYPPGTPPAKWHFPQRNRIVSGLCPATLVVCAPKKSGALITADFALEQNRDLYIAASGGRVFGEGCGRLAEDGAAMVESAGDILVGLNIQSLGEKRRCGSGSLAGDLARELGIELQG